MFNRQALFIEQFASTFQKDQTIRALPFWVCGGKVGANVSEPRCAEERIAHRVGNHVSIGMAYGTLVKRNFDAADDQFAALGKTMQVIPDSAEITHDFFCCACR